MKKLAFRIIALSLLLISVSFFAQAQQVLGTVNGTVSDTSSKQSMNGATITIFDMNDSSAAPRYGQAKAKGAFEVNNIPEGRYRLLITFEGYENQSRFFSVTKDKLVNSLGNIVMPRKSTMLAEVIVEKPPITIKKDTVEFNADSYKTKPNAVAEDLFKKLPGVQVDKSGTITAQGEQVTRILVDGKRFFSDDPKLASKNLPPDVIDKIQVFDDLSDQSKFTGFDDGNRVKTINIVTKKDKRKGFFGKVVGGAGTDGTYDNSVNIHRFDGNQQISLLGQGNDINKQNFTVQDILGTSGTNGRGGGGGGGRGGGGGNSGTGSGITTTWAGGLNYRDNWSPTTQAYGSYFFNSQHVSTDQQSLTQNIQPDSTTFSNQNSGAIRRNQNHRINFNIEQQLDSNNSFIFRPNIGFQNTNTNSSQETMLTGGSEKGTPIYHTQSTTGQSNQGNNGQYDLLFRHKFQKKYRTISIDMNVQNSLNNGIGTNYAINSHFSPLNYIDTLDQHIVTGSTGLTVSPTLSYTEPVGKNQIVEFNYNYSYTKNTSDRYTYSLDDLTSKYDHFDSLYSNAFINTNNSNRFTVNYRIQNAKYNFSVGSGLQQTNVNSVNTTKGTDISQHYLNFTPTVNFQYIFARGKNLRVNYSGRTGQPSINQLQPIITTSDSINFTQGNPNLKQQFTNTLRILYTNFNTVTQRVIFATVNASMINNDIQNSVTYNTGTSKGSQLTIPVNLNGTYNINGYFNYGFPLKKPKSNLNFITNASYAQSQTLVNSLSSFSRNTTLGETLSWTTNLKDNFDMNFSSATTYYISRNSLQPSQNQNYYTQVLSAEITYYTKSGWLLATNFDYTYNGSRPAGYTSSVPLLSPAIAKQIFKNKQGEIRLSVFDLLNQNVSVTRTVTSNTIQDAKTNVLTRYAMLTFTYNLRKFAGQGQKMPGMFRGMRNGMRNMPGFDGGGGGGGGFNGGGRRNN